MNQNRISRRIPMELPVEIEWRSRTGNPRQARGKTGNISGNGLFIEIPNRPQRATSIMIKVMLPLEITKVPMELLCQARVVRWNHHRQFQGVGAVIDEYELRRVPRTGPGGTNVPSRATE